MTLDEIIRELYKTKEYVTPHLIYINIIFIPQNGYTTEEWERLTEEQRKEWREKNMEAINTKNKQYYDENRERYIQSQKKYNKKVRDGYLASLATQIVTN